MRGQARPFVAGLLLIALVGIAARAGLLLAYSQHAADYLMGPRADLVHLEPTIIADNINAGRGFVYPQYGAEYRAWKEPLYIFILAGLRRLPDAGELGIRLFHLALGVAVALGVALLAHRLFRDPVRATIAGMLVAVNPFLVHYDTRVVYPLSMDSLLFVVVVLTLFRLIESPPGSWRLWLLAALVMGAALWQRAAVLAVGLADWGVLFLNAPREGRGAVARRGAVYLLVAIAIISPWILRNYLIFGRPLLTTDFPHIVWLGNNPHSNGTFADESGQRNIYRADPQFQAKIFRASEIQQYDIFWREIRRFVSDSPRAYLSLVLRRLVAFFWFTPNAGIEYAPWQRVVYRLSYVLLLLLGTIGVALVWRGAGREGRVRAEVLGAAVMGVAAVYALTAINMRHRLPLELVLAIFAAEPLWRASRLLLPRFLTAPQRG